VVPLKPLGIVAALPAEGGCLTRRRIAPRQPLRLEQDVWIYVSGMGKERARSAAECLLLEGAKALVSWGTAGALVEGLPSGTLILPSAVGHANGFSPVDAAWRERLSACLGPSLPVKAGTIAQSMEVLSSPEQKSEFHRKTGAIAVDMESATVGAAAERHQIPFLAIRSIVDPQEMTLPRSAIESVDEYGNTLWRKLLSGIRENPGSLPALIQLGFHFRAALATLRTVAQLAGPRLCHETHA
jgi:adenosylhomocysteine nucleosidase